jgi:bacteriocin-like protein
MRKHRQQRKSSTDTLLKTSKKKDIELTEKELAKVSGGVGKTIGAKAKIIDGRFTT